VERIMVCRPYLQGRELGSTLPSIRGRYGTESIGCGAGPM